MASISRRDQEELDELLSDIYRGIETLPDSSLGSKSQNNNKLAYSSREFDIDDKRTNRTVGRAYVREYELDESSPLVQQYKQDLAESRDLRHQNKQQPYSSLKRQTQRRVGTPATGEPHSLASFVTSNPLGARATPEHKRRVRIVDHREQQRDQPEVDYIDSSAGLRNERYYHEDHNNYQDDDADYPAEQEYYSPFDSRQKVDPVGGKKQRVKQHSRSIGESRRANVSDDEDEEEVEEEGAYDLDGTRRVEYSHTTWLDRQLGRVSKRKGSKELSERQVKEKAMIEELKRSLKNGAITLRQSFRGDKQQQSKKRRDDPFSSELDFEDNNHRTKDDYFARQSKTILKPTKRPSNKVEPIFSSGIATIPRKIDHQKTTSTTNIKNNSFSPSKSATKSVDNQASKMKNPHYPMGNDNAQWRATQNSNLIDRQNYEEELIRSRGAKSPLQQRASSTLNRMPSATEVVRSALSRSSSQASLNQLNKTINLLPNSPPPYAPSTTPTQQYQSAKATPSPSASPYNWQHRREPSPCKPEAGSYSSKTLGHQPQSAKSSMQTTGANQVAFHGTRTLGRPPQQQQQQQQKPQTQPQPHLHQQQQQPLYANPHASLMQHKQEQQMRQPKVNSASVREFEELDSLLRSLSPVASGGAYRAPVAPATNLPVQTGQPLTRTTGISTNTQITPGYSMRPAQPSFGGYMSQKQQQPSSNASELYAKVQKSQPVGQKPFTIDVTNEKQLDENCLVRQKTNEKLSQFEPPGELLPSMEDYQNISKLNPVTNRYWYKPNMSREHAINLLKEKPQGTFIVRDSTSFRGAYGLAMKVSKLPKNVLENANLRGYNQDPSAEYIRHFLIEPVGNGGVRLRGYANEPVFDNLADLIYQHSLTELALPCKLVIPRADIEDPKFNQKQKQFYDEFLASKEQAKHQPYERTSPNGGYRRYPGDVLVHNEHRIIFE